jgi:hypothetical protein
MVNNLELVSGQIGLEFRDPGGPGSYITESVTSRVEILQATDCMEYGLHSPVVRPPDYTWFLLTFSAFTFLNTTL